MPRNGHALTEAAIGKIDAEVARRKRGGERQRDENSTRGPTVAQTLIAIGTRCELFHDERDAGYALVTDDGINRVLRLRGRELEQPTRLLI